VIAIFINKVLQNKPPIIYGNGKQTRDYMFIEDAVNAYNTVLMTQGNLGRNGINFGSGEEICVNKIAELIIKHAAANKEIKAIQCRGSSS
jgi:UDP-glucose 4-epimerase